MFNWAFRDSRFFQSLDEWCCRCHWSGPPPNTSMFFDKNDLASESPSNFTAQRETIFQGFGINAVTIPARPLYESNSALSNPTILTRLPTSTPVCSVLSVWASEIRSSSICSLLDSACEHRYSAFSFCMSRRKMLLPLLPTLIRVPASMRLSWSLERFVKNDRLRCISTWAMEFSNACAALFAEPKFTAATYAALRKRIAADLEAIVFFLGTLSVPYWDWNAGELYTNICELGGGELCWSLHGCASECSEGPQTIVRRQTTFLVVAQQL